MTDKSNIKKIRENKKKNSKWNKTFELSLSLYNSFKKILGMAQQLIVVNPHYSIVLV